MVPIRGSINTDFEFDVAGIGIVGITSDNVDHGGSINIDFEMLGGGRGGGFINTDFEFDVAGIGIVGITSNNVDPGDQY